MKNRAAFSAERLQSYAEQWVAWKPDGTGILASSPDSEEALIKLLDLHGIALAECVLDYVPSADLTILVGP
jgi:hypothetical protein